MGTLRDMLRVLFFLLGMGVLLGLAGRPLPLLAQTFPTPTPDAEGNIYVEVQVNDSMWSIAARAGITLQTLFDLNGLTENSIVKPGDRLLIGRVEPLPTDTPEPTATPTLGPPTPTRTPLPLPETAVCLSAFDDLNRDGAQEAGEPLRGAVAFTIFTEQAVVANYITNGLSEPHCLTLEPGTYRITRSIGRGETLTNDGDVAVLLLLGNVIDLTFGSYTGATVGETAVPNTATPAALNQPPPVVAEAQAAPTPPVVGVQSPAGPNLLVWGVLALTAVLLSGGAIFAIRARRQ
ncbi:MAG: LysM peptidoglycan-binding domain-containing protein [Chloroflexi bacterium]|nr:LysM peptidoglycan-binding domain-containing protein [Chloroflexota bacterium]MBP7044155.1 LysM peptidoglycan-binding domain-containing protein [Chloroflexota bacterium]